METQITESIYEQHMSQLSEYAQKQGLHGLEGRLIRGLDPAGMLAVHETNAIVRSKIHPDNYSKLVQLTNQLHVGGIWDNAEKLKQASEDEVKAWFLMADVCIEVNHKDLTPEEYILDFQRVKKDLQEKSPDDAVKEMREKAKGSFTLEPYKGKSIPLGISDDSFLHMAICGYKAGIVKGGDLYFVGSKEFDFERFAKQNSLTHLEKEDRGRMCNFYQSNGKDAVKQLYPGLAIVFGNKELAYELALSSKEE
jgi:hypothetical protein